jgi:hypothetical protein
MKRLVESFEEFTSKKSGAKKLNEGTGNFYNRNASKVFAIGLRSESEEYEDDEEYTYDQIDLDNDIEYVQEELTEIFGKSFREGNLPEGVKRSLYSHSFETFDIGTVSEYIKVGRVEYNVSFYCFATSGYYEGANLDWVCYIEDEEGYEFEMGDEPIPTKIGKWIDVTKSKIESVYAKCSTPLQVTARFSNGETMYSKA